MLDALQVTNSERNVGESMWVASEQEKGIRMHVEIGD